MPITSFPGLELDPAISPAGNFVAFAWEGEGGDNFDIYVRSIDGDSQQRLTTMRRPTMRRRGRRTVNASRSSVSWMESE